jgi:hypothetical protein
MFDGRLFQLRYFFDVGRGTCLRAGDDATKARYGYGIDAAQLPVSAHTQRWLQHLIAWYDTALNRDDPGGPSPWSDDQQARFEQAAQEAATRLQQELARSV